jgi:hypothetical protein
MWSEAGDTLTRLSATEGTLGNVDGCAASWIAKCGVEVVATDSGRTNAVGEDQTLSEPTDNSIGAGSGAVYFYSPEQFVASQGVPGRRNLYVARDGEIHFVATLEASRPLTRIQVSPSGRFTAFVTATQLTSYDNTAESGICTPSSFGAPATGPRCLEMYVYDDESGELACASCDPAGDPPGTDVQGSHNGLFMSDDGRAFFSTADALVPQDTNGLIDVYEYVGSKPQLIGTGTANLDRGSNGTILKQEAGLDGVSADGTDVYFATFEPLVASDRNGSFLRLYDARTGGGFPVAAQVAPCAAADECHAGGSQEAGALRLASTADLGDGGNVKAQAKKKKKAKKGKGKKRKRGKHRRRNGNRDHREAGK